ncbi:DUF3613 domain-containing protein [Bordetella sp. BOR01]|uniref:DUF3613 domain-containing protein n=1 Tax=Bordetella sp. BOR01 TaxID=2854779 RepID=UPI001C475ACE|nr:DUF3613 domain-containing protein [Bordetella sp. BOR01]MBV7486660.1 DUF3613 domain-containing protein [Bordetella sp. BOR01]
MSRYFLRHALVLAVALPWAACAQVNPPLTGAAAAQPAAAATQAMPDRPVVRQMQTPMPAVAAPAPAVAASTPAASTPERSDAMGDVTRGLLAAQADGRRAGGALPILGPVSTASWDRYLESFRQPIPQWFTERVKTDSK